MKSWFFIADAHLSDRDLDRQKRLIRFLNENREQMECLVILGDLFDFWFGFTDYVHPAYKPLCDTLISLAKEGVRFIYIEGNHDFSLGPFFTETLHGEVYTESHLLKINGQTVYLAHGDLIDTKDLFYRYYRTLLKSRLIYGLIRFLGPEKTMKVKELLSSWKWMHRRREHPEGSLPDLSFAEKKWREGVDIVILAHTHRPCEKAFVLDGRTCYYFNVGDWIENDSYLHYHPQSGFRLEYYRADRAVTDQTNHPVSQYR